MWIASGEMMGEPWNPNWRSASCQVDVPLNWSIPDEVMPF
jgi:hypothetical protein